MAIYVHFYSVGNDGYVTGVHSTAYVKKRANDIEIESSQFPNPPAIKIFSEDGFPILKAENGKIVQVGKEESNVYKKSKIQELRLLLKENDWKVTRHYGQKMSGLNQSMSDEEFRNFELERQTTRDEISYIESELS